MTYSYNIQITADQVRTNLQRDINLGVVSNDTIEAVNSFAAMLDVINGGKP